MPERTVVIDAAQLDLPRRLRAVLFIDVVDSVRLIQADEGGTIARWRALARAVTEDDLPRFGGRCVKLQGDGLLAEFESTVRAVECAVAVQARVAQAEAAIDAGRRIQVRMGMHVSDVITDEFDIYGDGVNLAARLRDLGGPGEIVLSTAVRDQITDGLGVQVEDLGERRLKGFERPVRAFRAWPPGPVTRRGDDRRRRAGDRPAIAVLPFRDLAGDARNMYLGDLIADDLIGDLSRKTDLFVISRLSTSPFRDRLFEPRGVAEILGVRYVISGSMLALDGRLRMTAELTEAETAGVIWADRFEGPMSDIFALQDQLSVEIAVRVVPMLRQLELKRARAQRPEVLTAYERTLRAIDRLHRSTPEDLEDARTLLESAAAADQSYAAPHAWLGRLHVLRVGQGWSADPRKDAEAAKRHVDVALDLDSGDPWATSVHGLIAAYLDHDFDVALDRYDRALSMNPSTVSAWAWSASANTWKGNGEKAVDLIARALDLSPFDPHRYAFTSIACGANAAAGHYDVAIDWGRRSLRENRCYTATHKLLTIALSLAGRGEEARASATELLLLEPAFTVSGFRRRYPGSGASYMDRFCNALADAGVPR